MLAYWNADEICEFANGVLDESRLLDGISNVVLEKPVGPAALRQALGRFLQSTDDRSA